MTESFKSASELGIEDWERDALIWVLEEIEMGRITHHEDDPSGSSRFCMSDAGSFERAHGTRCGAVACIGGWMWFRTNQVNRAALDAVEDSNGLYPSGYVAFGRSEPLADLFHPFTGREWEDIRPEDAMPVIRNFLNGVGVDWKKELGE